MTIKVAKGYKGMGMDGYIARWYANLTEKNMADFRKDAQMVASNLREGAAVLEVAPGPGYLAIALAQLGKYDITGLDISATFVEIAQAKAKEAGVTVNFQQGNASQMPFADTTFDFIVCRAAFKNFSEPVQALDEMHRVLKPGGKAVIIDMRGDASDDDMNREVNKMGLGTINRFITKWTFKHMLVKRAYTQVQFSKMVAQSRFKTCTVREDGIGLEVWLET